MQMHTFWFALWHICSGLQVPACTTTSYEQPECLHLACDKLWMQQNQREMPSCTPLAFGHKHPVALWQSSVDSHNGFWHQCRFWWISGGAKASRWHLREMYGLLAYNVTTPVGRASHRCRAPLCHQCEALWHAKAALPSLQWEALHEYFGDRTASAPEPPSMANE